MLVWAAIFRRVMRKVILTALALVVLFALYWGWALIGVARLASAASQGDAVAVMQRVDLPALRRSLSNQIARAYLEQDPQFKRLLSIERGLVGSVGAGAAEALLREILTPEAIAALLAKGRAAFPGQTRSAPTRSGACRRSARRSARFPRRL